MTHAAGRTIRVAATKARSHEGTKGPGFTLIELLVVIVIIGILATLVLTIAGRIIRNQKVSTTRNTMRLVELAIDQFVSQDALRARYDNPKLTVADPTVQPPTRCVGRTFGPYPPYMLHGGGSGAPADSVAAAVEPYIAYSPAPANFSYVLPDRLHRDMGNRQGNVNNWVSVDSGAAGPESNDDIRALYAYLKLYTPGVLSQIPESTIKPLPYPGKVRYVNPRGQSTDPPPGQPNSPWVDVFGICDAWGVPLDYFLQVKLEYIARPDGTTGWMVTDRVPVLRSQGITPEEVANEAAGTDPLDPGLWIFNKDFPQPAASVDRETGQFQTPPRNGWVRAVAQDERYAYVPEP